MIEIGPTPRDEESARAGSHHYEERAVSECERFRALLTDLFPRVAFEVRWLPLHYGHHCTVVATYNAHSADELLEARKAKADCPSTWKEAEKGRQEGGERKIDRF